MITTKVNFDVMTKMHFFFRCEYAFDFETPAACHEIGSNESEGDLHDEL